MKIFSLDESYNVQLEPQAMLLAPFKALIKRDKTKDKTRAKSELAFVWFYCDIKSDYQIYTDKEERTQRIKTDLPNLSKTWKVDKLVQEALDFYESSSTTVTGAILKDSIYVANKLSTKMREAVDNNDEDLDIGEITKLLEGVKKIPDIIEALQKAEKAVLKEILENQQNIGAKEKALFEDGIY